MRIEDAPPAGWYPDPQGGSRLRWWEGTDWSDRYRSRPIDSQLAAVIDEARARSDAGQVRAPDSSGRMNAGMNTQMVVDQVRMAAREEAERAAQMFGAQARSAAQGFQPLITQYTTKITRWFRVLTILLVVFAIAWFAFQLFAQQTMFEWIGDRIDNLTDQGDGQSGFGLRFVI